MIHYGVKVLRPQMHAILLMSKPTRGQLLRGLLAELWFGITQAALFAFSFTCLAYAFRHVA